MSRAAGAKTRTDKLMKSLSLTPAITHEIVAGKLNNHDWNLMLDSDDGDDFGAELVRELVEATLREIFLQHISRQLIPYTVREAKDAILQIIEWQFLRQDGGEGDILGEDNGWLEDEEVAPTYTDCWAQGCVPRQQVAAPPSEGSALTRVHEGDECEEAATEVAAEVTEVEGASKVDATTENLLADKLNAEMLLPIDETASHHKVAALLSELNGADRAPTVKVISLSDDNGRDDSLVMISEVPTAARQRTKPNGARRRSKRHPAAVKAAESSQLSTTQTTGATEHVPSGVTSQLTSGLDSHAPLHMPASCHSMLKLQAGRPPGNRDIVFDQEGQVVSIAKLDMRRLPSHKVKMLFQVVDPAADDEVQPGSQDQKMQTGGRRRRRGRYLVSTRLTLTSLAPTVKITVPGPVALLDSIDIAPGVVIREGELTKKGPKQRIKKATMLITAQPLRPINTHARLPLISVTDLLDEDKPVTIRPLGLSSTIPPIAH